MEQPTISQKTHLRLLVSSRDAYLTASKSPQELLNIAKQLLESVPKSKYYFRTKVVSFISGSDSEGSQEVAASLREEVSTIENRFRYKSPELMKSKIFELVLRSIFVLDCNCNFITAMSVTESLWFYEHKFMLDLKELVMTHYNY